LPSLVAVFLDHFDGNSIQLTVPEECFQVFHGGAMATNCVYGEPCEVRTFELFTQLPERNPIALPANLEQSQRNLAFTMLPNFDREDFAGRLS
jgi:hypothetical protein